ncbi:hypothetical protein G9A89_023151 [Geosiphon pyriformis]|nr:hypothetical protein G9A89_023151 [Geosiphon pyriformis]
MTLFIYGTPDDESQMSLALIDRAVDLLANFKTEHIKHLVPVLSAIFAIRPQVFHTDYDEHLLVFTPVEDFTTDSEWAKCLVDFFNNLISNRRVGVSLEELIKIYELDPMLYLDEEHKKKITRSFELLELTLYGTIDSLSQENGMNFDLFREIVVDNGVLEQWLRGYITGFGLSALGVDTMVDSEYMPQDLQTTIGPQ